MKVLIYFEKSNLKPVGGPAGYLNNLYNEIIKNNVDYICFLDSKKSKRKEFFRKIFKKLPKKVQDMYYEYDKKNNSILEEVFDSRKRISSIDLNEYDIIHFHSTFSMYMIKDSLKDYRGKVILTSHSPKALHLEKIDSIDQEEYKKNKSQYDKLEIFDEYAFNRADYILFPTPEAEECYYNTWPKYAEIHDKNKNKYIYLPTGINNVTIYSQKDEIRKKYNIPMNAFVISYVGRHNEVKGYADLKKIGEEILKRDSNIYFLIGGKEEPIQGLDNERWIEIGWTDKPHDLINASDMFILPNKETYFDLILLEVLSVGKTVLVTDTGGNKYFKRFKDSGIFYYEYGNKENAINMIETIKKQNLKLYDKKNKEIFKKNFTIDIFTKKYIEIVNKIYNGEE